VTMVTSYLKARAEIVLKQHGLELQFIEDKVGSKNYLTKEEQKYNFYWSNREDGDCGCE